MHMMTKRADAQAVIAAQGGAWRMVEHLDGVVRSGWRFDRRLFETHGSPGANQVSRPRITPSLPRIDSPHRPRSNGRMDIKPLGIGLILFGILAIGGTLDGARRKFAAQPEWVALNWKSVLLGLIGWLVAGVLAVLAGVVMLVV
jgi:hypothetical protein